MATAGMSFPIAYQPQYMADNDTTSFLYSIQNALSGQGQQAFQQGQSGYQTGLNALAPTLQYLTQLTKGDQADVSQAIQPEANRIRDSFAAVRNMISAQPRGGGKAGELAEAPYKEQQQIADTAAQARSGAAGELGNIASTLAGTGLAESQLGLSGMQSGLSAALQRRGQNFGQQAANQQFASNLISTFI